jgi:hypothetical protein
MQPLQDCPWDQPCLTHDALVLRTLWLNCVRIFHREKERMRYAQSLGMVIALVFILECGSSSSQTLSGTWQLTLTSSASPGTTYTGTATLTQSGNGITGTVSFINNACATSSLITGTVSGSNVSIQVTEGGQVVTLTGTINSAFSSMSGSYTSTPGGCTNGDLGSWTATTN